MAATGARAVTATDGTRLRVLVWPAGSDAAPFLLVHGLASNAHLWDGVGDALAGLGHSVAAVDLRGHGRSDKPDHGYEFATVCDDLLAVIEDLGFERPVVAGQSWGGNVVVELAQRAPDALRGVAAVDGGTIELSQAFPSWEACAAALRPPLLEGTPAGQIESTLRAMHADWPQQGIDGAMANFEIREDGTVAPWLSLDRHMRILRQLYLHRPSALWADVATPVLLIPAEVDDRAIGEAKRAQVDAAAAALPHCRVHWLRGDHDLHAQQPETVAALLGAAARDGFFR